MSFNLKFNLHTAVMDLHTNLRKSILFSLVGTLNTTLIDSADRLAQRLEEDGYDFRELEYADYKMLLTGPDETDGLADIRSVYNVAKEWREALRWITPADPETKEVDLAGSWYASLNWKTGVQGVRAEDTKGIEGLAAIGIATSAADLKADQQTQRVRDQNRADARARRKAATISIYETVFATNGHDTEYFSELSAQRRELLTARFFSALDNATAKATHNVRFGLVYGDALGLGDIVLIRDLKARLMLEAFPITPITTTQAKPKVQRVKKDGTVLTPEQSAEATRRAVQRAPSPSRKAPGPVMEALVAKIASERTEATT